MNQNFDPVAAGKSTEKLEDEIAAVYQEAHRVKPGVRVREAGILAVLWAEFDRRAEAGLISDEA